MTNEFQDGENVDPENRCRECAGAGCFWCDQTGEEPEDRQDDRQDD